MNGAVSTRRGFTLIELLLATMLVGVVTALSMMTFRAVSRGWQVSTDYMDKMQRTDYAINQVTSALRSMYYPHDGEQTFKYGFQLMNKGEGEDPRRSDVITWSKKGAAIVGNKNSIGSTVHRVQLMVLEEGDDDYREPIEVTGLYARLMRDSALIPQEDGDETDYGFGNAELYQPLLIADGIVGFNCRVIKKLEDAKDGSVRNASANDKKKFEDEFAESNAVPYKVELTFRMADPEGRSYRRNTAPLVRIVRIPVHEQSLDGAEIPGEKQSTKDGGNKSSKSGRKQK